jgi:hypothetical protein
MKLSHAFWVQGPFHFGLAQGGPSGKTELLSSHSMLWGIKAVYD